jgi:AcrR family transcriptional regulator
MVHGTQLGYLLEAPIPREPVSSVVTSQHGFRATGSRGLMASPNIPQPESRTTSMREQFLERTIEEFARTGPGKFNPGKIARELGVSVAMINHYFASRYGLVSDAAYIVYSRYVDEMFEAVTNAPRNPEERLRAWIRTQISVSNRMGGWGVVLNYPTFSLQEPLTFDVEFRQMKVDKFELNLTRLAQLIVDVNTGTVSPEEITEENLDTQQFLSKPKLVAITASIGMSTLGSSVWLSGSHSPSADSEDARKYAEFAINSHIDILVNLAKTADLNL